MLSTKFWLPVNAMSEGPEASPFRIEGRPVMTLGSEPLSSTCVTAPLKPKQNTPRVGMQGAGACATPAGLGDVELTVGRKRQMPRAVQARRDDHRLRRGAGRGEQRDDERSGRQPGSSEAVTHTHKDLHVP